MISETHQPIELPKQPVYKKWWFWVIIGVVVIGVIGAIIGNATKKTKTYNKGEWAEFGQYGLQVVEVEDTQEFGKGIIGHYATQNNYVCVLIELKNNSNSSKSFFYNDFTVSDGGHSYESQGTEAYWYAQSKENIYPSLYLNGNIDGGLSGKFYLVFETAQKTTALSQQLKYTYGFDIYLFNL